MGDEEENDEQPIPETGAVFTFGRSRFADNVPNRFWIRNDPIISVACGDEHTLLLTNSGRVFTFGANDWGQLGHANTKVYTKPTSIKALKGTSAHLIACGRNHSIVALENNRVLAFGQNTNGELGVCDTDMHNTPVEIDDLAKLVIKHIDGGAQHSAALTENGQLYLWGSNAEGQLGMPRLGEETHRPTVMAFPETVCRVACGYYHTAIVTRKVRAVDPLDVSTPLQYPKSNVEPHWPALTLSAEGNLFTFGEGEFGKLGHPVRRNEMVKEPRLVDVADQVAEVACGGRHTIALTQSGQVHVFGDGSDGQLGLGEGVAESESPRLLERLAAEKIIAVACGESHSAAITDQNQIYVWGNDQYGKLGIIEDLNEHKNKYYEPRRLQKFVKFDVIQVSGGGCHTIVLAKPNAELLREQNQIGVNAQKRSITSESNNKESYSEDLKRHWDEGEKENIEHPPSAENGDKKLPKLISHQKSEPGTNGTVLNARARRRQTSVSNTAAPNRDQAPSLADRAASIAADVHRSLNGTSYSKLAITDICHDSDLLKKFDKTNEDESDEEPSTPFRLKTENSRRKSSNTEMLHKEINRSLTVFCRGEPLDEAASALTKGHKKPNGYPPTASDDDSVNDAKTSSSTSSNRGGGVYGRQSTSSATAPIHTAPPTRITAVAQKYASEKGVGEPPLLSMSASSGDSKRYVVDGKKNGDEGRAYDLTNLGQSTSSQDRSEDDADPGLSMVMDRRGLSAAVGDSQEDPDDSDEVADQSSATNREQTILEPSDAPLPDVKSAFAENASANQTAKGQGPMRRIAGLISRAKEGKNAKANGAEHANGKEGGSSTKKSRACTIL